MLLCMIVFLRPFLSPFAALLKPLIYPLKSSMIMTEPAYENSFLFEFYSFTSQKAVNDLI